MGTGQQFHRHVSIAVGRGICRSIAQTFPANGALIATASGTPRVNAGESSGKQLGMRSGQRSGVSTVTNSDIMQESAQKPSFFCIHCGRHGHEAADCRLKQREERERKGVSEKDDGTVSEASASTAATRADGFEARTCGFCGAEQRPSKMAAKRCKDRCHACFRLITK